MPNKSLVIFIDDFSDRAPEVAPTPNAAPLPLNNDDELLTINPDIV